MINTSTREGLPNAIMEALAYKCAILAHVDPESIFSRFGYHANDDDFETGLKWLLDHDRWRNLGEKGHRFTKKDFEINAVIEQHLEVYEQLIHVDNSKG